DGETRISLKICPLSSLYLPAQDVQISPAFYLQLHFRIQSSQPETALIFLSQQSHNLFQFLILVFCDQYTETFFCQKELFFLFHTVRELPAPLSQIDPGKTLKELFSLAPAGLSGKKDLRLFPTVSSVGDKSHLYPSGKKTFCYSGCQPDPFFMDLLVFPHSLIFHIQKYADVSGYCRIVLIHH